MDAELLVLETKIKQLADVCSQLRAENHGLRQDLIQVQDVNQLLQQKLNGTRDKVSAILAKLPEEMG